MKKLFVFFESKLIGQIWMQSFYEMLHRISLRGMYFNQAQSIEKSGEIFAMQYANKRFGDYTKVIFDVGGNNGEWTLTANKYLSHAKFYVFEPSVLLREEISNKLQDIDAVFMPLGLSSERGTMKLFNSGQLTATSYPIQKEDNFEEIEVIKIDEFCDSEGITEIFYLKIDVEGNEFKVLEGCLSMIRSKKVKYIQFEYGPNHIISHVFLKDFFDLLENYKLYRIVRGGLRPLDYNEIIEIPLTNNYLAELKTEHNIF